MSLSLSPPTARDRRRTTRRAPVLEDLEQRTVPSGTAALPVSPAAAVQLQGITATGGNQFVAQAAFTGKVGASRSTSRSRSRSRRRSARSAPRRSACRRRSSSRARSSNSRSSR